MKPVVSLLEGGILNMGIDLRGIQIGVSEQFLQASQVGSAGEHMCSKGVAQDVRARSIGQLDLLRGSSNDPPDLIAQQGATRMREEPLHALAIF